ncbi:olfactory receptor 6N1 [Aplochiton taeniatus]
MNSTLQTGEVSTFLVQGLSSLGDQQTMLFIIFLLAYIIILVGNSGIIFLVRTDPKLHCPMYFFILNLSMVDIIYTTVTIPNMLSGFLTHNKTISLPGCLLQMYSFTHMAVTGRAILTVMAYDRYMAICRPLHYVTIMTPTVRHILVLVAWSFGAFCTLPTFVIATQKTYCGPKVVRHCWCDPSSVRALACGDTSVDAILSLAYALFALLLTGSLILASYVLIAVTVSKMAAAQRWKAIRTCGAHLIVVLISYGSASFVYISYRVGNFSPEVRIIVAILYTALTPFLNPMIYSLRNKELREAVGRLLCPARAVSPPKMAVNALSS